MTHFLMRFLMYLCRETFEMMLYTKPDDLLMSIRRIFLKLTLKYNLKNSCL